MKKVIGITIFIMVLLIIPLSASAASVTTGRATASADIQSGTTAALVPSLFRTSSIISGEPQSAIANTPGPTFSSRTFGVAQSPPLPTFVNTPRHSIVV